MIALAHSSTRSGAVSGDQTSDKSPVSDDEWWIALNGVEWNGVEWYGTKDR